MPAAWWEYGEAGDGPDAARLVHGFRGDHHGLEPVISYLPGVHIIAPDLPGFGASGAAAGRALDRRLRRLARRRSRRGSGSTGPRSCSGTRSARSSSRAALAARAARLAARSSSTRSRRRRCPGRTRSAPGSPRSTTGSARALPEGVGGALLKNRAIVRGPRRAREDEGAGAAPLDPQPARPLLLRLREPPRRARGVPRLRHPRHHRVRRRSCTCPCTSSPPSTTTSRP